MNQKTTVSGLLILTLLGAIRSQAAPKADEIADTRRTIAHQERLVAAAGNGNAGPSSTLLQKALHSNRARLLELLTDGRLTYITALELSSEELGRAITAEEKRAALQLRASHGVTGPCPAEPLRDLAAGAHAASTLAADTLAHENCPHTPSERESWLARKIETSPKRRGVAVLYESPYLRIEWQGVGLSVFSRDTVPGNSPGTSYAAATVLKERWLTDEAAPGTREPPLLPMALKDRADCVISRLIAAGWLIPREPTPEESSLAERLADTRGAIASADRKAPPVIPPAEAQALKNLEFAGMFQIKSSGPDKPLVGTWGLGPCVGVSLWNPKTKTASVVHLDPTQSVPDTLREMLQSVGGLGSGIEARIIGGWTGFSERTLLHTRDFMKAQGIPIVQEDTLGFEATRGSRGFIVDSRTGKLFARVGASQ